MKKHFLIASIIASMAFPLKSNATKVPSIGGKIGSGLLAAFGLVGSIGSGFFYFGSGEKIGKIVGIIIGIPSLLVLGVGIYLLDEQSEIVQIKDSDDLKKLGIAWTDNEFEEFDEVLPELNSAMQLFLQDVGTDDIHDANQLKSAWYEYSDQYLSRTAKDQWDHLVNTLNIR